VYSSTQKFLAEFIGTFTLCFIGIGAICADQMMKGGAPGAFGLGLLGIALAFGLAIATMVCALSHVSGAHFNPAVTIGFWVSKTLGTIEAIPYLVGQLAGATAASFLLKFLLPEAAWRDVRLGTPSLSVGFGVINGMILEAVMTFLLVWVIFATAADPYSSFRSSAGFAIGLTMTMGIMVAGPFTGGALNPARAFGPALAMGYIANQGIYWVGPLFGGAVAGSLYSAMIMRK
jgi:MIP family channel proteins